MTALALVVSITMYHPHTDVLFCGGSVSQTTTQWVAMPYRDYGITWQCGDRIGIWAGGELRVFTALDAGPFGVYCVRQADGSCPPIAADVPDLWWWGEGISDTGRVFNITAKREEFERRAGR